MHILEKQDLEYIWHPFTQMSEWQQETPLVISSGSGVYLKDIHGKKYLDGVSSLWANVHGHKKLTIDNSLRRQIRKISHSTLLGLSNVPAIQAAKMLVDILPNNLKKIFFAENGASAVEIALKMAYQYWQLRDKTKKKFVKLSNAYHGDTIGAVSLGGMPLFHSLFSDLVFETIEIPAPYCYRCPLNKEKDNCSQECLIIAEKTICENANKIAGLIIEPLVQGAAGIIVQPKNYLQKIACFCKTNNILLILDEVATGFGKTGSMFACQKENIEPDLICLGKGITGGYLPLSATVTTQNIFDAFLDEYSKHKTFYHGHTYTGNPLACVAAIANLKVFKKEKTIEKLQAKIDFLKQELIELSLHQNIGDIRQMGIMIGIEIVKDKKSKAAFLIEDRIAHQICKLARKKGLIIRPLGDVIVLMPPLSITLDELNILLKKTKEAIKEFFKK